jgi:exodeoxyribonuclease V alpha subunit
MRSSSFASARRSTRRAGRVEISGEIAALFRAAGTAAGATEPVTQRKESVQEDEITWRAGRLQSAEAGEVRFVGADLPMLRVGLYVRVAGYWGERHPLYGDQLMVTEVFHCARPNGVDALVRYLVANIHGCRGVTARRIVSIIGGDCLSQLAADPSLVVPLFPSTRGRQLEAAFIQWSREERYDTSARALTLRLFAAGVAYGTVRRVMKFFDGADAAEAATLRFPYRLTEVPGIGWVTADRIARLLGIAADAPERIEAACHQALSIAMRRQGHSGLPAAELVEATVNLLDMPSEREATTLGDAAVSRLQADGFLVNVAGTMLSHEVAALERQVASATVLLASVRRPLSPEQRLSIDSVLTVSGLSSLQQEAVLVALSNGVATLTGRPGTGKTTTIRAYASCCRALGWDVKIVAPSGKAAARASTVTGVPASTVHRLLGGAPGRRPEMLRTRALVIDESSMCDLETAAWLLSAVDPIRTSVLWMGDADQLPSVGHGQVFRDLIDSEVVPEARLTEVFRQRENTGEERRILTNAHRLLDEEPLVLENTGDWCFLEVGPGEHPSVGVGRLVEAVRAAIGGGADPREDIQVLAPRRGGPVGVDALNAALQPLCNPNAGTPLAVDGGFAKVGDRVIVTRNMYDLTAPLYNGETGVVTALVRADQSSSRSLTVRVDGREVVLRGIQCDMVRLAWAITVHRAQGSEYPYAMLAFDERAHSPLVTAPILYTALTRASRRFTLVGTREAVRQAASRGGTRRYTGLALRLREAAGGEVDAAIEPRSL